MNRRGLVIDNLEFCENNKLDQSQVQGGGIFDLSFGSVGGFVLDPSGSAAAGAAAAVAVAIGKNSIALTFTSAS